MTLMTNDFNDHHDRMVVVEFFFRVSSSMFQY